MNRGIKLIAVIMDSKLPEHEVNGVLSGAETEIKGSNLVPGESSVQKATKVGTKCVKQIKNSGHMTMAEVTVEAELEDPVEKLKYLKKKYGDPDQIRWRKLVDPSHNEINFIQTDKVLERIELDDAAQNESLCSTVENVRKCDRKSISVNSSVQRAAQTRKSLSKATARRDISSETSHEKKRETKTEGFVPVADVITKKRKELYNTSPKMTDREMEQCTADVDHGNERHNIFFSDDVIGTQSDSPSKSFRRSQRLAKRKSVASEGKQGPYCQDRNEHSLSTIFKMTLTNCDSHEIVDFDLPSEEFGVLMARKEKNFNEEAPFEFHQPFILPGYLSTATHHRKLACYFEIGPLQYFSEEPEKLPDKTTLDNTSFQGSTINIERSSCLQKLPIQSATTDHFETPCGNEDCNKSAGKVSDECCRNISFLCCLETEAKEPVKQVHIVPVAEELLITIQCDRVIEIWRKITQDKWTKVGVYNTDGMSCIKKSCLLTKEKYVIFVLLICTGGSLTLKFLTFDVSSGSIQVKDNNSKWNRHRGQTRLLLCELEGLTFATCEGTEYSSVEIHCFEGTVSEPLFKSRKLGDLPIWLSELHGIQNAPEAVMGWSVDCIYVWNYVSGNLVTVVNLMPSRLNPFDKCLWAAIHEEGQLLLLMTFVNQSANSCQLVTVDPVTGLWDTVRHFQHSSHKESETQNRLIDGIVLGRHLVLSCCEYGHLWDLSSGSHIASLVDCSVSSVTLGNNLLAFGLPSGCLLLYSLY